MTREELKDNWPTIKVANIDEVNRLLNEGWDFCEVEGQLNDPSDDETYYDAETDKIETV